MKLIKDIIDKHLYDLQMQHRDDQSLENTKQAIAREICEILEAVFDEVEYWDQPDTILYFNDVWRKFKQANGLEV